MTINPASRWRDYLTHCPTCGKLCYATRKAAKAEARRVHPGERMNAYRCGTWWHYGHLMTAVRRGYAPRPDTARRAS